MSATKDPILHYGREMVRMRTELGMEQIELDHLLGVARNTVWTYESSPRNKDNPYGSCTADRLNTFYTKLKAYYDKVMSEKYSQ